MIIIKKYIITISIVAIVIVQGIVISKVNLKRVEKEKEVFSNNSNIITNEQNTTLINHASNSIQGSSNGNKEKYENDFLDLTQMTNEMAVVEVYNMKIEPDKYLGKTIKISGEFYAYSYEENGEEEYYTMWFTDVAGCCSYDIELRWDGVFPESGSEVQVVGSFGYESEVENDYFSYNQLYLDVDTIEVL